MVLFAAESRGDKVDVRLLNSKRDVNSRGSMKLSHELTCYVVAENYQIELRGKCGYTSCT